MNARSTKWSIPLAILLALLPLVSACGPAAVEETEVAPVEPTAPVAEPTAQAEEPTAAEEPAEPLFVAFAHVGPVTDEGWSWTHHQGMLALEEFYGDKIKTAYIESMPYSEEATRTLEQFVADGADLIICTSAWGDFVTNVAKAHPDVAFMHMTRVPVENELGFYIQHQYPSYVIGIAAGMLTKTNMLGYVGTFPSPTTKASASSFHLGARSVNPDVTTHVTFINSWFDPAAARQAAEALVDSGADVLFGITDDAAYLEVAEERGVWAGMWNTDVREFGPNAYISSVMLDWSDLYIEQVQKVMDGTFEGGKIELLPMGAGTDRDEWGQNVPQEVRDAADAVRDRILNEGFNPFTGPLYDDKGNLVLAEGEELGPLDAYVKWNWVAEGVIGFE